MEPLNTKCAVESCNEDAVDKAWLWNSHKGIIARQAIPLCQGHFYLLIGKESLEFLAHCPNCGVFFRHD